MSSRNILTGVGLIGLAACSQGSAGAPSLAVPNTAQLQQQTRSVGTAASGSTSPGSLDTTFGSGGRVLTPLSHVGPDSAALQNGNIVVATALPPDGTTDGPNIAVVRYLANGSLDTSFASGGVLRVRLGNLGVDSVAVQSDGKIVLATGEGMQVSSPTIGLQSQDSVIVARFNPSGTFDQAFGTAGIVTTAFLGNQDTARVLLVQPDGKILLGGGALVAYGRFQPVDAAFARYNPNGSLDKTFGSGGKVLVTGSGGTRSSSATIGSVRGFGLESDGSILATLGPVQVGSVTNIHLAPNGAQEPVSLSGVLAPVRNDGAIASVPLALQPNGDVLVGDAASGFGKNGRQVQMKRFALTGTPDPSFSSAPFVFNPPDTTAGQQSNARAIAVQPNASIVVGGRDNTIDAFSLAQLNPAGPLDTAFGRGGFANTTFTASLNVIQALLLQADGKIIAIGDSGITANGQAIANIAITRYLGP